MAEPLHILVLGSAAPADRWRAEGHRVTEVGGGRARVAWQTWRGAGRDADVVLEIVDGRAYLSPLWGWIQAPRVLAVRRSGSIFDRLLRPLLYGDVAIAPDPGLDELARAAAGDRNRVRDAVARSETAKAAGLAAATLASNAIQLAFTVAFTRLLGVTDYGSLAVLISAFLILLVAGSAVQVAAARDTALGVLGTGSRLSGTLSDWVRRMAVLFVVVSALSILVRQPFADLIGVPEHAWAAAGVLPTGVAWLWLCLQRGILQGVHAYAPVARSLVIEAIGRLAFGLVLVGLGAGVTGAWYGSLLALVFTSAWVWVITRRRLGPPAEHDRHPLATLFAANWRPMVGLGLLGALQNVDVIVVKHQLGSPRAGSYAAAAVAAKAFVWVAIGIGLHLLPEATRRAAEGRDPRPVLKRALQIAAIIAAPALVLFAAFPHLILRVAFGEEYTNAASALVVLGGAMMLLGVTYLTAQYLIALGRLGFLWVLAAIAVVEPVVLFAGDFSLLTFALIVLGVQVAATTGLVTLGLRGRRAATA
jgi:O-antigen/teichoic acid export membrane protein